MNTQEVYLAQINRAKAHTSFRHYTTIEALSNIFSSKSLRLSCLHELNDPIEENRVDEESKLTYFITCFSHEVSESIPMWRMYGRDGNGICLEFSDMSLFNIEAHFTSIPKDWYVVSVDVLDVLYTDDQSSLLEPSKTDSEQCSRTGCIGYVKTKVWAYEQETRVRCRLKYAPFPPDYPPIFSQFQKYIDYDNPPIKYLYLSIPEESLTKIKIRFNPFMSDSLINLIKDGIRSVYPTYPLENFLTSSLRGKIKLK